MTPEQFHAWAGGQKWRFASTQIYQPHYYVLRNDCIDAEFRAAVVLIREHGYHKQFKGRSYVYFDSGDWSYWTMGHPIDQTILINRARTHDSESRRNG